VSEVAVAVGTGAETHPATRRWTEAEFLVLDPERPFELVDGRLEELPVSTEEHDDLEDYMCEALREYVRQGELGKVRDSGVAVKVGPDLMRYPDVVLVLRENYWRRKGAYLEGADLVMEVVSPGGRMRDFRYKRLDYEAAGISEYWIIDPLETAVTVLTLDGGVFREHGVFTPGHRATSVLLPGFAIDVEDLFRAVVED
jgi:Uma2 family endonuclease